MKAYTKDGTLVEITVGGSDSDDIQILSAEFIGTSRSGYPSRGRNVTDADITWIETHFAGELYEEWLDGRISAAEDVMDRWRER